MNTKDTQINEVLARGVGYTYENLPLVGYHGWLDPEGQVVNFLPPFTHSLDACGVVVDKLIEKGLHRHTFTPINFRTENTESVWVCDIVMLDDEDNDYVYIGEGPTMAAAFCNAVLKIIEGEENGKV